MTVSMDALADDLHAESADLRAVLASLAEDDWRRATPAAGWTIIDQITHLAYFDDVAVESAAQPELFRARLQRVAAEGGVDPDRIAADYRHLTGADVIGWFDESRARLIAVFRDLDPGVRVPWFGPAMSAASLLTARIMETWAHGQDVCDTIAVRRVPTGRLRHVAHLGVLARPYSFAVRGRQAPLAPIRVELAAPDGTAWTWGPADAADRVCGPAQDFCLAVTQRRHRDDTALQITGPAAEEWMAIAQAFAGPAGAGRAPGRFAAETG
ncbi:MAG TPA: TIGR03084 family metal-binding protein [Kribbellaceae bacterium]|jgi:uncharacterized protein (TIGR03084 family)